jgi:hypothetical protein
LEFLPIKTSSPCGDLISYLPGIRQLWLDRGQQAVIYQRIGMPGSGYPGAIHPFQDTYGQDICFTDELFDLMKPLLMAQEYVMDYKKFEGQHAEIDMDKIRMEIYTNQPKGSLNRWPFYAFPQMTTDLSVKWLDCFFDTPILLKNKIVLNFTQRYRNHIITYFFLKKYEPDLIFVGLPHEHDIFCKQWNLNIHYQKVKDFLELAEIIASCKLFCGNQSMAYQIAEGLKVPRILELFPMMPNVVPQGPNAYDFYHQTPLEYFFEKLTNEENK